MFSPGQLRAVKSTSIVSGEGIQLTWVRRTRQRVRILNTTPWGLPPIEPFYTWRTRVKNANGAELQVLNSTGESAFVSTALQLQLGVTAGAILTFEVQQIATGGILSRPAKITHVSTVP